jgi:8-oxo-dGTP pyrophosphatase MutT (NUDIX family)
MDLRPVAAHEPRLVDDEPNTAAVLIPVVERADGPYMLFTKRADHLAEHPGQMSFPGGGAEPGDADIRATALREVDEEIGLRADEVELLGRLDDIRTITQYAVTPLVGRIPDREYTPNDAEVAEIVVLPVAGLVDPENYEYEWREHPEYGRVLVHYFHVGDYTVWGATGRIVVQFLELATDWEAPERTESDLA